MSVSSSSDGLSVSEVVELQIYLTPNGRSVVNGTLRMEDRLKHFKLDLPLEASRLLMENLCSSVLPAIDGALNYRKEIKTSNLWEYTPYFSA